MASFSSIGVGLGGGVDVNALIKASVDAVKLSITRPNGLNDQIKLTDAKISTFGQVKSLVSSLQMAAGKLSSVTNWNAMSASSSDSKFISASAIGGTVETTFNVEVSQLAKAQVSTADAIPTGTGVGAGTLHLQMGKWSGGSFTAGTTPGVEAMRSPTAAVAASSASGCNRTTSAWTSRLNVLSSRSFQTIAGRRVVRATAAPTGCWNRSLSLSVRQLPDGFGVSVGVSL